MTTIYRPCVDATAVRQDKEALARLVRVALELAGLSGEALIADERIPRAPNYNGACQIASDYVTLKLHL